MEQEQITPELQQQMDILRLEVEEVRDRILKEYPTLDLVVSAWHWQGYVDATIGCWFTSDNRRYCVAAFRTWEEFQALVGFCHQVTGKE